MLIIHIQIKACICGYHWVCRRMPMNTTLCSQVSDYPVSTPQQIENAEIEIDFNIDVSAILSLLFIQYMHKISKCK